MKTFSYERRLHWSECDPAGIIFFPHYARWMVEGLNFLFLSIGVDPNGRIDKETVAGIPSVGFSISFHQPPRLHEIVTHEITIEKIGRSSLTVNHRFLREDICLAEAKETRVWAAHSLADAGVKSVPIPDEVRRQLEDGGEQAPPVGSKRLL
ncbi:acyl-CoA thioesterase [Methylobacterium nodulans]|uniref:Thioesterase superfamily protein n=1 Tax=Methylobacterium nodulans (strain LMG 21967 / CNCM I-2342 / ORS 2060) TaxID=460265 RepID=B8IC58_METNO|nr:thioesterase family protein [Methylobacterium nodulans]ACL61240.1 thioesterase superfamily protein [Methylobacterium nodulans ORS 2060]